MVEYTVRFSIGTGEQFPSRIKYFHYGVVSVELETGFRSRLGGAGALVQPLVISAPRLKSARCNC
jgi:hypothetical protein